MLTPGTPAGATAAEATRAVVLIVMGPAGSGKSFVGERLAASLGWPFADGDAFHPPENVARMRAGLALGDTERAPWLAALGALVAGHVGRGEPLVLACSALRVAYRRALVPPGAAWGAVRFVYLRGDPALLAERLAGRAGHFFAPALLVSQLEALEPPGAGEHEPAPVLTVDAGAAVDAIVETVRGAVAR